MVSKKRIACIMLLFIMLCVESSYASVLSASYVARCNNLKIGDEYRVHVELQDQKTGAIARSDGRALSSDVKFKATKTAMDIQVGLRINKEENAGKTLLVKAILYKGNNTVAVISDGSKAKDRITVPSAPKEQKSSDTKQKKQGAKPKKESSVSGEKANPPVPDVPHITVTSHATDAASGTDESKARKNVTIYDNLELKGLVAGAEYTAKTMLLDAESGKPLGKAATGKTKFKAKKAKQSVRVGVSFDASDMEDREAVTFTEVYRGDELVAETTHIEANMRTVIFNKYDTSDLMLSIARYNTINGILHMTKGFLDLLIYDVKS